MQAGSPAVQSPRAGGGLHAAAQTYITMIRAGVPLFYDEKAPIFEPSLSAAVPKPSGAVFYCPTEVKDIGLEAAKIRSSRVAGILFDDERIYLTYNTGNAVMKWETRAELRLLSLVESRFCRNPARAWYSDKNVIGLMLGDSMDTALLLLAALADTNEAATGRIPALHGSGFVPIRRKENGSSRFLLPQYMRSCAGSCCPTCGQAFPLSP